MKTVIITFLIASLLLLSPPVSSTPLYEQTSLHPISIYFNHKPDKYV